MPTTTRRCWVLTTPFIGLSLLSIAAPPVYALAGGESTSRLKEAVDALGSKSAGLPARFSSLRTAYPAIADYVGYWQAQAHFEEKDYMAALAALDAVWKVPVESPLAGRAAVMGAESLLELQRPGEVIPYLNRALDARRPQPDAWAISARAAEASGDLRSAAILWQKVYYRYSVSVENREAEAALARLRASLGSNFPTAPPAERLERGDVFVKARLYTAARRDYLQQASTLTGLEAEQARVRAAAVYYSMRRTALAATELRGLELDHREADAERFYWLVLCYRRLNNRTQMHWALDGLKEAAPRSPWRQRALLEAGNSYLVENGSIEYEPLYQECAADFLGTPDSASCHWWTAWRGWMDRRGDAGDLMRSHLSLYPTSVKAGAALYYLGRLSEINKDHSAARRYWQETVRRFPNSYYGVLSRDLLAKNPGPFAAPEVEQFLSSVRWPDRERSPDFEPAQTESLRLTRAQVLERAALPVWAESELRFGVRAGDNPWPLAMEAARIANRRGEPSIGLRHILGSVPSYLFLPRDAAPREFWRLVFPFPYRTRIERHSKQYDLDPFLVAALIRQESLFDPLAVSPVKAIGLMQVMPSTGRELSRKVGIRPFRTSMLKNPDVSIRLGTYYLQRQLSTFQGSVEETLAAYNAGPSRPPRWRKWSEFREPPEFVETIPFQQTRDYVQIIVRNVDVYRWLYDGEVVANEAEPVVAQRPAPSKSSAANKKTTSSQKATSKKKATASESPSKQATPRKAASKPGAKTSRTLKRTTRGKRRR